MCNPSTTKKGVSRSTSITVSFQLLQVSLRGGRQNNAFWDDLSKLMSDSTHLRKYEVVFDRMRGKATMKPWYMHLKICAQELCTHVLDLWILIIMHKKYLYIRSICIHWYRPVCECIICLYIWYLRTHTSSGCLKENNPPELHSFQTRTTHSFYRSSHHTLASFQLRNCQMDPILRQCSATGGPTSYWGPWTQLWRNL